jgi:hypothetical protein
MGLLMPQKSRDDFPTNTKKILQARVGSRCSNPSCQCTTSGPNAVDDKVTCIGVAAHITAASPGGPRYNADETTEHRKSIKNGIWLCENCAKLIDVDPLIYTVYELHTWKEYTENLVGDELGTGPKKVVTKKDGNTCTYCGTFVNNGLFVCLGCQAEISYGSTREEFNNDMKLGALMGGLIITFLLGTVFNFFGLNATQTNAPFIWVIVLFFISGIVVIKTGRIWARHCDTKKRAASPRFIRNMHFS